MRFYVGMHHPSKAHGLQRAMVSHNVLRDRKSDFEVNEWILDSGAFSQLNTHGEFQSSPQEYASDIARWSRCGDMHAAVSQDFMCEPAVREEAGGSVEDHQHWTVDRYDKIRGLVPDSIHVMPVLQGWDAEDYVTHLEMYGDRLKRDMWVGVGSVCSRNSHPADIEWVLRQIQRKRPDLRLHGFGVKSTALRRPPIRGMLFSADSMAWSYRARRQGRDANSLKEAQKFARQIRNPSTEVPLFDASPPEHPT